MLNNQELKHLQKCELIIANEIRRICEKNNIKYFMVAGSVLGSVRHEGFIPWDDDMDFGMLRNEYERFCDACKKDLNSEFILQTWDNDTDYPFSYGKIRLKGTKIYELFAASDMNREKGIFVDIFPFDNVPDNKKQQRKQGKKYFFYNRALWIKKGYGKNILNQGNKQRIKYMLFSMFCFFIPYSFLKIKYKKVLIRYNKEYTSRLVFDTSYSFEKNCVKRKWITNLTLGQFEEDEFPIPQDYDEYLTHLYGDYMKFPDPDKRHNHDILKVDFGKY